MRRAAKSNQTRERLDDVAKALKDIEKDEEQRIKRRAEKESKLGGYSLLNQAHYSFLLIKVDCTFRSFENIENEAIGLTICTC